MPNIIDDTAVDDFYGVDDDDFQPEIQMQNDVQVPDTQLDISEENYESIQEIFDPLQEDGNQGVDTLQSLVQYLDSIDV